MIQFIYNKFYNKKMKLFKVKIRQFIKLWEIKNYFTICFIKYYFYNNNILMIFYKIFIDY